MPFHPQHHTNHCASKLRRYATGAYLWHAIILVADSLPPPPGWRFILLARQSGHITDTPVGSIPGYAQLPPPPGWRITSPLVIGSVKARAAACHFRFIRSIRVLDCYTQRAHFRAAKKAAGAAFGISFVFVAGGEAVNGYAQHIFPLDEMRKLRIEYRYAVVLDDTLYKRQLFCILE